MHKRADTPCDSTTATAEPGTPQPNFKINNSAKNMFKTEANIKKYKGVLLSPRALTILASRLYMLTTINPPTTIKI